MGNIIRLPGGIHLDIQALLPWYVSGQLDAHDLQRVEAHLAACRDCSAQLEQDAQLETDLARRPGDVEQGWAAMREQLELDRDHSVRASAGTSPGRSRTAGRPSRSWKSWLGWTLGPQLALASCLGAFFFMQVPRYTALDGGAAPSSGNLIVIFEPEISEQVMRRTLRASQARLVDGPTAANAYVLQVPFDQRERVLAGLRNQPQIVLAEPIEPGGQP